MVAPSRRTSSRPNLARLAQTRRTAAKKVDSKKDERVTKPKAAPKPIEPDKKAVKRPESARTRLGDFQNVQHQMQARLTKQLPDPVKAATDKADAAQTEARKLNTEATTPAARREAVRATDDTLNAQRTANDAAREADKDLPFPDADVIKDARALAEAPKEIQERLIGAPASYRASDIDRVRVEQAQRDAGRLADIERRDGPRAAAEELANLAERTGYDRAYADELTRASQGTVSKISEHFVETGDGSQEIADSFSRAGEALGTDNATDLARELASHHGGNANRRLQDDLLDSIKGAKGTTFSAALMNELVAQDKGDAALGMTQRLNAGMTELHEEFTGAQEKVDELNNELGHMVTTYGPLLSDTELTDATTDFFERHKEDYDRLEAAGADLATTLNGAAMLADPKGPLADVEYNSFLPEPFLARSRAQGIIANFPELSQTSGGVQATTEMLKRQAIGETTALDRIKDVAAAHEDEEKGQALLDASRVAVVDATTTSLATNPTAAERLLDGLEKNRDSLFEGDEGFDVALDALKTVQRAGAKGDTAAIAAAVEDIPEKLDDFDKWGSRSPLGRSLQAAGAVLGAIGTYKGIQDWENKSLLERSMVVAGGTSAAAGTGQVLLKTLGKADKLYGALGKVSGAIGVLGTANDLKNFFEDAGNGDWLGASSSLTSAAGGGILAAAALGASVPVAGWIAAVGLIGISVGIDQYSKVRESNKYEGPAEDFLEGAGIRHDIAKQLSNHNEHGESPGAALTEAAKMLNQTPEEFLNAIEKLEPGQVKDIVEHAHRVPLDDEGNARLVREDGDNDYRTRWSGEQRKQVPRARSVEELVQYVEQYYSSVT